MVKRILRKYKYPPDQQEGAVELVLRQAEAWADPWALVFQVLEKSFHKMLSAMFCCSMTARRV